jgi:hypothetical protein
MGRLQKKHVIVGRKATGQINVSDEEYKQNIQVVCKNRPMKKYLIFDAVNSVFSKNASLCTKRWLLKIGGPPMFSVTG